MSSKRNEKSPILHDLSNDSSKLNSSNQENNSDDDLPDVR